ncbi:MAG: PKD domain-containing protein, partial [Candidatus Neomarinimicrobiota bacterium]
MWNIKILLTLIGFILFNQPIFSQYSSGKNSYKPDLILDNRTNVNQLRESNAKDILRHSSDFNQSFQKKERLNLSNRNLGVSVPYVAQPINNDQLSENSISFDNPGITHRDFLDMGRRPQIAQANDGTLWTVFIYDMGGAYSEADGRNDMVVYSSVDDGVTWNYSFYIYNASANIDLPDVEALDDRLLFLHSTYYDDGTSTMGIFWLLNDFSNYNTTFLEMPEGFDTFEWGSILADKFYYDIESTWVYITYMVWDSSTGNAGVYYTRSIDFGLTLENLTQMFTESMYTEDVAGSIVYYRPGIATAYSYGFEEFVWTSLSMNGDVYASKIDVYTNEVTNQVVMAADEFNENRAPSISAYYENIVIFSSMSWLSGDYNNDLGMTFSYDEGQTWGDESAYYYWPDPSDFSESGATPNFAPDGVMGFAYISESSFDESDYVFFRSNSTGNFLNGWDESVQVGGVYTDVGIIGSVIQNSVFSMVFDDDPNSIIYFESFSLDEIQYGNVSGYITNATNGNPVSGAFIQIGGQETFTDNSGYYFISEVSPAAIEANFFAQPTEGDVPLDVQFYNLTSEGGTSITATADGYATYFDNTLELIVGETISYNVSLSPLDENYMRFVLNWDDEPADLDIHLITESSHIYYGNTGDANSYPYATLDQDVTQGYGPETITISQSSPETYKLYVYNYTQDPSITTSNAVLQAYSYGEPVFTVNIPETGSGEYWHVADVNGQTNSFSLVNEIQNSAPEFEGSSDGDHLVGIDIMTDNYPGETSWELTDYYSGAVVASGGPLSDANSLYNWEIYVETSAYYFTIFDSFGDGICCTYGSGYYTVYSDGYEIATSQFSGASESVFINFTRSNGGNYAISRTEYLEPIPFAKGTNLAKNDNVWPTSDLFLIREGTFGIQEDQIPLKQSNYTRDITFTWDFGDGNTSNDATPLHTYSSAGNYTVSLTASDGVNNSLYERVDYIVVNQGQTNQAPVVANPIGDISLVENESEEVNLNFVFSDPDGDALSYSVDVTSDDGTPVVASVSGTSLTITGIGGGQATVTVTASDAGGLSVTDELLVTVTEGNSAPFVLNEI